jgi:hypothetical protein
MITRAITWLFAPPEEPRQWWQVIAWWELRRIPYNLIVGGVGFISLLLFYLFISLAQGVESGIDAIEPLALLIAPILLNMAFTAGWLGELFLRIAWQVQSPIIATAFLKLGLSFSLLVAILPSVIWSCIWIARSL